MQRIFHALVFLAVLLSVPLAFADVVKMKDGRTLEGKVIKSDDKLVTLKMRLGEVILKRDEIESIVKGPTIVDEYKKRAAKLKADDADGHFKLALWCNENKLPKEYREELAKTIEIDPDHAGARARLGQVKHEGKWVDKKYLEDEKKNPWKKEIRKKMEVKKDLVFSLATIDEVAAELQEILGVPVAVDSKVVKDFKKKKARITGDICERTLKEALDILLSSNALDYTLKEGGLIIHYRKRPFTAEELEMQLDTRYYKLAMHRKASLEAVAAALRRALNINVLVDPQIYKDRSRDEFMLKYHTKAIVLRRLIEKICEEYNLDYVVKDKMILITTKKIAEEYRKGPQKPEKK
jgi:hypothetical protein